jgi:hypothetical protein
MAGMNPYDYVGGNPETWSDPTGQMYAPPRGGGGGGGVGGPVGGGGGVNSGGSGGVNPYWPPPGGVGPDACQVYGCKQVANLDAGSDWVWVPSGGSRTGSVPGGTTCSPVAMGGLAEITCTSTPTQGYTSGNTGGDWVRVNRPPIQVILCTLGFNCSDESTGPDEGGASKAEILASDEGAGASRPESVTYSRVQGGTPPNASRFRISVNVDGSISIVNKSANLNVSVASEHAYYFQGIRGSNSEIVQFDLPNWFDAFVAESAIIQYGYTKNPANQGGTQGNRI